MKPLALHHVAVLVTDLDDAVDFYVRTLGMTHRTDRPSTLGPGAWLSAGDQQIHLTVGTPPERAGQHLALHVADLDAASEELRREGVDVSPPVAIGTARQAFLSDPSGNAIELHEPAPAPTP